jgi:hypothetical protein
MKVLGSLLLLAAVALGQEAVAHSMDQFVGTYRGAWQSQFLHDREGTGAAIMSITMQNGILHGHIMITGSPIGYKGDDLKITVSHFADDIMAINFKAEHSRLSGTGIFEKGRSFVGDYRFRYLLTGIDRGQWMLEKEAPEVQTSSAPVSR